MNYLLFLLIIVVPVFVVLAYRQGLTDCQRLLKNEPVKEKKPPDIELSEEDMRAEMIRQNIENYQGSERGQIEIDS